MIKKILCVIAISLSSLSCSQAGAEKTAPGEGTVTVTIVGSAESPDPVLERVFELERKGVLKDVIVMESFPVQIRLTGPVDIIKELESIPRIHSSQ